VNFLKRNVFYIACGLAAAGGVALAVTGLGAMPDVEEELEKAKGVYDGLGRLTSRPANEDTITAEKVRIDMVLADADQVLKKAEELYGYEPLVADVFPDGDNDARFRFRERYNEAMTELFESLKPGAPATRRDVDLMTERIEKEIFRESQKGLDEGALPDDMAAEGPAYTKAGVLTKAGVKNRAVQRAAIQNALNMYVYATPDVPTAKSSKTGKVVTSSLNYHPYMSNTDELDPPIAEDVWAAQLEYWIQKDVVDAINTINEQAGDESKAKGGDRWVGVMPVKELISIRFAEQYILDDDDAFVGAKPGGQNEALPCGTRNTVFTNSQSNAEYDVVQFTVKLIMDQRDIMKFVKEMSEGRFHTLLRVAYTSEEPNRYMTERIYGPDPIVNVVLDFETIMLPSVFHPLMPQVVCDMYDHIECPERDTEEEEEG
jgi:hypothetical protein